MVEALSLFTRILGLVKRLDDLVQHNNQDSLDEIYASAKEELEHLKTGKIQTSVSNEVVDHCVFFLTALLDEKALDSDHSKRESWMRQPLQILLFKEFNAGETFFSRLDQLNFRNDPDQLARAIAQICLSYGFKGKFFDIGSQSELQAIISANSELLKKPRPSLPTINAEFLSSSVTTQRPSKTVSRTVISRISQHKTVIIKSGLVLSVVLIYWVQRVNIEQLAEQIGRSVNL